jgi:Type II secretion system (T2SS), protein G
MTDVSAPAASKPKSTAGWVFGGLAFIPMFGVVFGIIAIIIGAVRKTRGQIYLGIAGILFSVLLYGGIFYFGFIAKTGPFADLKVKQVSQLINLDAGQIALYKGQHGKLPDTLDDVGKPSPTNLFFVTDPWGTKFKYTKRSDDHFELTSAGPDRQFGTADDVTETF